MTLNKITYGWWSVRLSYFGTFRGGSAVWSSQTSRALQMLLQSNIGMLCIKRWLAGGSHLWLACASVWRPPAKPWHLAAGLSLLSSMVFWLNTARRRRVAVLPHGHRIEFLRRGRPFGRCQTQSTGTRTRQTKPDGHTCCSSGLFNGLQIYSDGCDFNGFPGTAKPLK